MIFEPFYKRLFFLLLIELLSHAAQLIKHAEKAHGGGMVMSVVVYRCTFHDATRLVEIVDSVRVVIDSTVPLCHGFNGPRPA